MFGEGKFELSKLSSPCLLLLLAILIVSVLEIAGWLALMPEMSSLSLSMNNNSSKMANKCSASGLLGRSHCRYT